MIYYCSSVTCSNDASQFRSFNCWKCTKKGNWRKINPNEYLFHATCRQFSCLLATISLNKTLHQGPWLHSICGSPKNHSNTPHSFRWRNKNAIRWSWLHQRLCKILIVYKHFSGNLAFLLWFNLIIYHDKIIYFEGM